jgi:ElaB/YqjD/DUF883 family membrane-anchored ribosome-binding protein
MSDNRYTGGFNQGQTGSTGTGGTTTSSDTPNTSLTPTGGTQGTGGGAGAATATAEDKGYGAKIAEAASTAKDYVADKVSAIGDKLSDLKNTDIKEVANQAKDYARQNPGQAILISAAAGLVLGLLIRGSRR